MASEDSVKYRLDRLLAPFTSRVHRVGNLNDLRKTLSSPVFLTIEARQDIGELAIVRSARTERLHFVEQRYNLLAKLISRLDGEHEDVRIVRFWSDPSVPEVLLSHFKESASVAMLIDEEHRLDVVAEGRCRVFPNGNHDASFALDHAGQKPAVPILA